MNKLLKIFIFFCLATTSLQAQSFLFSPKVGANISSIESKLFSNEEIDVRGGWHAGIDIRAGEGLFFVHSGIYYQSMTAEILNTNGAISFEEESKIKYLKIPMNLGLRITESGGLLNIHARGGIVPNLLVGLNEVNGLTFDKDSLHDFSLGANVGVGVDILILTLDARYEFGLTDMFKGVDGKNNVFMLSVGLVF